MSDRLIDVRTAGAERLWAAIGEARHWLVACVLCRVALDDDNRVISMWLPGPEQMRRLAPAGKERVFMYGVCVACADQPDRDARVEERIIREEQLQ
jgi:hypothetical protein